MPHGGVVESYCCPRKIVRLYFLKATLPMKLKRMYDIVCTLKGLAREGYVDGYNRHCARFGGLIVADLYRVEGGDDDAFGLNNHCDYIVIDYSVERLDALILFLKNLRKKYRE